MKTFKVSNPSQVETLKIAFGNVTIARKMASDAKKLDESAKAGIYKWLKEERGVEVESLAIGEIINIEGLGMLKINKMNKFNEKEFLLKYPALHAEFMGLIPVKNLSPQD